jgi:hypothetical protein
MKHAGPTALESIAPLLTELRALDGLVEKSPGTFYRRSRAFLHFHEDPTGVYADVRLDPDADADFERQRATAAEQKRLVQAVRTALR